MEYFRYFDLLKAFGYIDRVGKADFFFSEKTYFTSYVRNMLWATVLCEYHEFTREIMMKMLYWKTLYLAHGSYWYGILEL